MMLTTEEKEAVTSGAKLVGAWGSVSVTKMTTITAWAHLIAEIAAATLTILLVGEFLWKKIIRPFCEYRGWIKRKPEKHENANSE